MRRLKPRSKAEQAAYFDRIAAERDRWKQRNPYYHRYLERLCGELIPPGSSVLEIGCATGDLLAAVQPRRGVGVDLSPEMVRIAKAKHPHLEFIVGDAEELPLDETFDAVVLSDLVGHLPDIWAAFRRLHKVCRPDTRVIITYYNYLWEPILSLGERIGLKMPQPVQNWLPLGDLENLLYLGDLEVVRKGYRLIFPFFVPLLSAVLNRFVAKLPGVKKVCLLQFLVARPRGEVPRVLPREYVCSVVVPCRNEAGNIEGVVGRVPPMGKHTEIVFVDGASTDGTRERIVAWMERTRGEKDIKLIDQGEARGKGDAVRKGFEAAAGDVLMILDADLTVAPEDLPKFYQALAEGKGEFINGSRLVYPMEGQAMRLLNLLGNKIFSVLFTWLLDQRIRDTLCGTKVLFKRDYQRLQANRVFFGEFDPFGDFDLLFGAAKLNLRIVEVPVRYRRRVYGMTKISRFLHGWLLLRMCGVAFWKFKLS